MMKRSSDVPSWACTLVVEKAVFMSQARVPLQSNTYTGSVKRKDNRLVSDVCKSLSVGSEDCRPHPLRLKMHFLSD